MEFETMKALALLGAMFVVGGCGDSSAGGQDGSTADIDGGAAADAVVSNDGGTATDGGAVDARPNDIDAGSTPDADPGNNMCTTPDATRCGANNSIETCVDGTWQVTEQCAISCSAGGCESNVACNSGERRCNGSVSEICNATGSAYLTLASCPVDCDMGLCIGECTPGERRCNGDSLEECDGIGSAWAAVETCTLACDSPSRTCVHDGLDIASNMDLDGDIVVSGAFILRSGATLRSSTGELTIRAQSITVELGASIVVDAVNTNPAANPGTSSTSFCNVGGGHGGFVPLQAGTNTDAVVGPGAQGGLGGRETDDSLSRAGTGGGGGGVVRLFAEASIVIAGEVRADGGAGNPAPGRDAGGGGGGAGGGILIAAPTLDVTGTLSAQGGSGGSGSSSCVVDDDGLPGADGFVKTFSDALGVIAGTVNARHVRGMRPPLIIASSTHPDTSLTYNDGFDRIAFAWSRPFAVQGYFWTTDQVRMAVPTAATGTFAASELAEIDRSFVSAGDNFFHLVPIDAMSLPGTIQNYFHVRVNSTPPTVSSTSHPNANVWYASVHPFFGWTLPHADSNYRGFYYVLDQFGDTVPDEDDTWLDVSQPQILLANVPHGIYMFHVISVDRMGYRTREAARVRVNIGPDPGAGTIFGRVRGIGGIDLQGATVTVNRGLLAATNPDAVTLGNGAYNMMGVPAGTWEVTASAAGYESASQTVVVTDAGMIAADFNLVAVP